jgi:hypothetical protein
MQAISEVSTSPVSLKVPSTVCAPPALLAMWRAVSEDMNRSSLTRICVERLATEHEFRAIATDGVYMAIYTFKSEDLTVSLADFHLPKDRFFIRGDDAKAFAKTKVASSVPVVTGEDFPAWEQVVPSDNVAQKAIAFDPEYLKAIGDLNVDIAKRQGQNLKGVTCSIRFDFGKNGFEAQKVTGVAEGLVCYLMPYRLK